jgi:glycerophosphoryl diester phosphodiesterase
MYNTINMVIIGHRGAPGYEPENTLASFEKAIELGANMIELDTACIQTGEVIVIHDASVNRTTNGKGRVAALNLMQLRLLDAGKGQHIPMLDEVIEYINRRVPINIELKQPGVAKPTAAIIKRYMKKGWKAEDFIISSFHLQELKDFKASIPSIRLGSLIRRITDTSVSEAIDIGAFSLHPSIRVASPDLVTQAHELGLKVFVYTVNRKRALKKMETLGVDGVITNYPDRAREIFLQVA